MRTHRITVRISDEERSRIHRAAQADHRADSDWARVQIIRALTEETTMTAKIRQLRNEAGTAGDLEMVAICDRALDGDDASIAECVCILGGAK